jgi:hypothetical protein
MCRGQCAAFVEDLKEVRAKRSSSCKLHDAALQLLGRTGGSGDRTTAGPSAERMTAHVGTCLRWAIREIENKMLFSSHRAFSHAFSSIAAIPLIKVKQSPVPGANSDGPIAPCNTNLAESCLELDSSSIYSIGDSPLNAGCGPSVRNHLAELLSHGRTTRPIDPSSSSSSTLSFPSSTTRPLSVVSAEKGQ